MPEINFFWDPLSDNILQERDETGAVTAEYTAEPGLYGNVISQNRGGVESQFHYDAQGSTLAATDDDQNVTDTFAYTAFGEVTERTGATDVPFQYIGQKGYYTDSLTGQIMVRRRPYEPSSARWLAVEPTTDVFDYGYVANSPLNSIDPAGLFAITPGCIVLGDTLRLGTCELNRTNLFYGFEFEYTANFKQSIPEGVCCTCCEYRQYVTFCIQQFILDAKTKKIKCRYKTPECGSELYEDCREASGGIVQCRGHRSDPQVPKLDEYDDPYNYVPPRIGCTYRTADRPGVYLAYALLTYLDWLKRSGKPIPRAGEILVGADLSTRFLLNIIDTCNGGIAKTRLLDKTCRDSYELDFVIDAFNTGNVPPGYQNRGVAEWDCTI